MCSTKEYYNFDRYWFQSRSAVYNEKRDCTRLFQYTKFLFAKMNTSQYIGFSRIIYGQKVTIPTKVKNLKYIIFQLIDKHYFQNGAIALIECVIAH